jgi:hypothetical protein
MKPHLLIFFTLLACRLCGAAARAEEKAVPQGYAVERYAALWERSPFTTASAVEDAPPAAAKLALAGLARIGSEDTVTVLNKESQERIIVTQTPNAQGYKLVSVEPNADPLKVVVTLLKGDESIKVRFDPTLLAAQSKTAPPPGQNPLPNANPLGMPTAMPVARPLNPGSVERQVRRPPIPLPVIPNRAPITPPTPNPPSVGTKP